MAKPQLEDGHTKIANEIVEALARVNLSAYESRVLWCIFRKTYGWNKKSDRISYSQFQEVTGMDRRHLGRTLRLLIERQMITCQGEGQQLEYAIQKDWEQWREANNTHHELLPKGATEEPRSTIAKGGNSETDNNHCLRGDKPLPKGGELLPKGATEPLPKGANTKARKHLTKALDKSNKTTTSFEDFRESLRERFKDLDFNAELEKFHLYWYEGRRKPPANKKLALLNWMQKARQISAESDARRVSARGNERLIGGDNGRNEKARGIPGNRPAGAFDDLETG